MTPDQRVAARDLALNLANDSDFYVEYVKNDLGRSALARRNVIAEAAKRNKSSPLDAAAREQIRRYLDQHWGLPHPAGVNKLRDHPTIDLFDDGKTTANDLPKPQPQPQPKETTMSAAPITVTTKTLVNDQDITTLSDAQIYELIAGQELKIKELEKIENKPKKLVNEIEKRKAGIQALVTYLDSKPD